MEYRLARELKEYSTDTLVKMVLEIGEVTLKLEDLNFYRNDESFFNFWYDEPYLAVQAVCNKDYNATDDYVQSVNGHAKSFTEEEVRKKLLENEKRIVDEYCRWLRAGISSNFKYMFEVINEQIR